MARDLFAQIADGRARKRTEALVTPHPPVSDEIVLPLEKSSSSAAFQPLKKIETASQLRRELARLRKSHAKFLRDFAPPIESGRMCFLLEEFDWRIEEEGHRSSISALCDEKCGWEKVRIPHYGPPLGRAVTYYRTSFRLSEEMMRKGAVFIRFKGVDYKAHVFVNGTYLGSHEGFFAPFEFDFTSAAHLGDNQLLVVVENDAICMGNTSWGEDGHLYEGDKLYAATGPGYDDPEIGWHHCPPGMGIYQDVIIEARSPVHISDLFIRPIPDQSRAEAWVEVYSCHTLRQDLEIELSVYGQNFRKRVFADRKYQMPGQAGPGVNYLRLAFDMPDHRLWDTSEPWLYQLQARAVDENGEILDAAACSFGMRSFHTDEQSEPKGRLYLNGRQIRLRGANTMGFEQQCVMKKDWNRLIDDILLAKACNMNFLRMTQRPVQSEVYDYCDRLGLMTQTDLPLFGVLRRNQFCEAVKQAEEMERLVRAHPCNITVSYINEPLPNGWDKPHRNLTRPELERFFTAASEAVRLSNPDRVIKPVDGDYDPPSRGLPDNHCYCGWYNGHGLDIGKLHKGYWQQVKPDWHYGCGEFGAEGLDPVDVMRKCYPSSWLPQGPEEEKQWTPDRIIKSQAGRFHYMWFDTQRSLRNWVRASQAHQAWTVRLLTEAFRRDNRMNSFAIHLFIDAFPSGWMKSIMDVERQPKPAYFIYRDALTPLAVNLRTDRYSFYSGEFTDLEAWICNDLTSAPEDTHLHYQLEMNGKVLSAGKAKARVPICGVRLHGFIRFEIPMVSERSRAVVRLGLIDSSGKVLHDTSVNLDIFPRSSLEAGRSVKIVGNTTGNASRLAHELGLKPDFQSRTTADEVILIDNFAEFDKNRKSIMRAVESGAKAVFMELPAGDYNISGDTISIVPCGMGPRHFVSRATGHRLVKGFEPNDFKFWYDSDAGYVTPFLSTTFDAPSWNAVVVSGNGDWTSEWHQTMAVAEKKCGNGSLIICQLNLAGRLKSNPVATLFAGRLIK
ncbi:MAG: glycoside hydrolase family 2 protein [Armatimonadota bacterium]